MDKSFEQEMRKALLARRGELASIDSGLEEDKKGLSENDDVDLVDHGQHAAASDVIMTLDDQDRRELGEIDAALERIAEGTYGICAECEEEIPTARLEVLPEARTCTGCAESRARSIRRE